MPMQFSDSRNKALQCTSPSMFAKGNP